MQAKGGLAGRYTVHVSRLSADHKIVRLNSRHHPNDSCDGILISTKNSKAFVKGYHDDSANSKKIIAFTEGLKIKNHGKTFSFVAFEGLKISKKKEKS